ncbi:MAG TPA: M23 family metallopeptidase [Gemmatimonadota bacterium]|nr:M23 family metallopeptidase [Gemmatimonadota bacterium]
MRRNRPRAVRRLAAPALLCLAATACAPVYGHAPGSTSPSRSAPPARVDVATPTGLAGILGSLVWPLALDRASVLSSVYGSRHHPLGGADRFHGGLDLRAPEGTPVYAVAAGRVADSGHGGAYGLRVVVDHGEGLRSLYAHHRENLVTPGEKVRRGQVIALVGHTGNATGDHLHFELRWKEGTIDPRAVLPPLGTAARRSR